jgi:hypothetical protein
MAAVQREGLAMIMKAVIALMLFSVTSSADAASVLFKNYRAPKDASQRILLKIYLDGIREGLLALNSELVVEGRQPVFCVPGKLALNVEQAEDIMIREAQMLGDVGGFYISAILINGLKETFPCDEKH